MAGKGCYIGQITKGVTFPVRQVESGAEEILAVRAGKDSVPVAALDYTHGEQEILCIG